MLVLVSKLEIATWFQNTRCATPMNGHAYSTDFSFQVAIALENFF
jgi:hypothetical protein